VVNLALAGVFGLLPASVIAIVVSVVLDR